MSILKTYSQEKKEDKFGEAYARTLASLMGNLKEMELLLKNYNYIYDNWEETMKDVNEIENETNNLVKRYNEIIETIPE